MTHSGLSAVEQIKEKLSILEVVSPYVELTRAGKSYKGKSPFVTEKTPSFFVSPEKNMYYCFSTQKGGDMFTFIQEMEGVDFKGALKILAEKAGIELVPEDPKKRDAREQQYALLKEATLFFFKAKDTRKDVCTYIEERGVHRDTTHVWQIGYAPDEWRALRAHLSGRGYTDKHMLAAGLIKKPTGSKEPYDVFRNRVMFPICDSSGRVVAFSGRTLENDPKVPKYVNSPETELFQKSHILFGYDKAKQGIRHHNFSLIVEGQFDVVLAHQAGYTNTVAVSGTACTHDHIALLDRISHRAVLALDADRAGIHAARRTASMMLKKGMDVKIARLPEGKDPADCILENPNTFKKIVGTATHIVEFLLTHLKEHARDERTFKLQVRDELLPLVAAIPNRMDQDHFIGIVAAATQTSVDAIRYETDRSVESERKETIHHTATATSEKELSTARTRRRDQILYLLGIARAAKEEHPELSQQVYKKLSELIGDTELAQHETDTTQGSKYFFTAEQYLETVKQVQLYHDISHELTQLAHTIARSTLTALREHISTAEKTGAVVEMETYADEAKHAQLLLQTTIELTVPTKMP